MDHKEMIKRTKKDLRSFNTLLERLKELRADLNYFQGQEELFSEDVQELNSEIQDYEYRLKIIKISLSILCDRDQKIITEHYFDKIIIKDIAIKLNLSSKTVFDYQKGAIEELANIMYDHLEDFDDISFRDIPKKNKRRGSRIYQYDLQGNFIKRWDSANECNENGFDKRNIYGCCTGTYKQYKGYKWFYKPLALNKDEAI
jgi:predicted DNA-binding protein YlxM (UPF0122 family)